MAIRVGPEDVVKRLGQVPRPSLIAIDGLPCSGKSTGAEAIQAAHGFACVYLDGFVRAEAEWPATRKPAFPFEFIRYDEFVQAVRALKVTGQCTYAPFDWQTLSIATVTRTVTLATPVIVEGVSSLNRILCSVYDLKISVDSDRATILPAAAARAPGIWMEAWRDLFLPSADLYMQTRPEDRADLIVRGRRAR